MTIIRQQVALLIADGQDAIGVNTDIIWGSVRGSFPITGLPTALISLQPGKSYKLTCSTQPEQFSSPANGFSEMQWVDVSNVALPNGTVGFHYPISNSANNASSDSLATVVFTPSVVTSVKLRITNALGTANYQTSRVSARIESI